MSNLKSIAVVEDDASLLAALENFIGSHGIEFHGFANAEAFLARKDSIEVDCLITDVQMDGMGGVGLFNTMRRNGDTTPVVFITAFDDERIHRQVMSAGAIAYFHKPFDCEYVIECIETCLAILSTSHKQEKNMPDISKCIQDWVDAHITSEVHEEDKLHLVQEADDLKTHALAEGFTIEELRQACDGDILAYLKEQQNSH